MLIRLLCAAALFVPLRAGAQWHLALLGGTATTQGDSRDTIAADRAEIRADRITVATLAIERAGDAWRFGAELRRLTGDLSEVTASASIDPAPICSVLPSLLPMPPPAVCAGTFRSSITISGITMRKRLPP